jgi:hypothetical protein
MEGLRSAWQRVVLRKPQQLYSLAVRSPVVAALLRKRA